MYRTVTRYAFLMMVPVILAACNMTTPSQLRTGQIQMKEDVSTYSYPLKDVSAAQLRSIARDHAARGYGPASITVSYLGSHARARQDAQKDMREILSVLQSEGMTSAKVDYVAVNDATLAGQAVFSYPALHAQAPDHCKRMPGYQGGESLEDMQDYQISCESKDVLSRMVARPADLLGNDGKGMGTGRRTGAVVETYQAGEPNELFYPLSSASGVGN